MLAILPVLAIHIAFALGLGISLGVLNVFFRDVGQFFGIFLQFWFWLTPIVWMFSIVPEKFHSLFLWNPMTGIIMGYQNVILYEKAPELGLLIYPALVAFVALVLSAVMYKRAAEEMADAL